ncbi:MAG: response regulator [Afipia sp.]|nr:response regulator [Afipia sp.]
MPAPRTSSDFTSIQRPACPKCRTEMSLSRIMPARADFDLRTFECPKCNHVEKAVATTDPINSYTLGWFLGELKPPI